MFKDSQRAKQRDEKPLKNNAIKLFRKKPQEQRYAKEAIRNLKFKKANRHIILGTWKKKGKNNVKHSQKES